MIAGSILVFKDRGHRPGAGMRRGTIGLFSARIRPACCTPSGRPAVSGRSFCEFSFVSWGLGFPVDRGLLE